MERCPLEISQHIFSLACTDGGYTGSSLSLVSSSFHFISKPIQLQSVALRGLAQMRIFLNQLKSRPPEYRKVKHLFISDRKAAKCTEKAEDVVDELQLDEVVVHPSQLVAVLTSILYVTAPTLHTLSFHLETYPAIVFIPSLEMPYLTDLAINKPTPLFGKSFNTPNLHRLHITSYKDFPHSLTAGITSSAHGLTHLRISGVNHTKENGDLIDAIEAFVPSRSLNNRPQGREVSYPNSTCPSGLKKFIIDVEAYYPITPGYSFKAQYGIPLIRTSLISYLEELAMDQEPKSSTKLVVLQAPPYIGAPGYWDKLDAADIAGATSDLEHQAKVKQQRDVDRAYEDWLDWVSGGYGPWMPEERCIAIIGEKRWQ